VATGTGLSGGPITGTGTIVLANTAVSAAAYTSPNLTINAQGQITAATNVVVPSWIKCTVTNNGTDLVVTGTGCTLASTAKAAALTQNIILFALPARGYVSSYRVKSSTAFTGTTTLKAGLGTTASTDFFLVSSTGYDLKAAVSATNMTTTLPLAEGSDTAAGTNAVLSLTSTVDNLSAIATGALDVWVLFSTLP